MAGGRALRFVTGAGLTRREWLRLGGLFGLGLALPRVADARPAEPGFGRAKSVLFVFASGGQSQIDMWDPKPDAPAEVRGVFRPVRTAVPGTLLCEHLPRLAHLTDRFTILRTASHDDLDHGSAAYAALTGHMHPKRSSNPPPSPNDLPTYGAVVQRLRPTTRFPYSAVHVNGPALVPTIPAPGQFGGVLGHAFDPLVVGDVSRESVALHGLDPVPELPPVRLDGRRTLLRSLDAYRGGLERDRALLDHDANYRHAYELLSAPQTRRAFDLDLEPAAVRDRYGRHRAGQACLLGRRLVEAGVPLVTVVWNHTNRGQDLTPEDPDSHGWDTHNDIFDVLKGSLLPRFDESFSALLLDLEQRGLLDTTLVVCMGEFGRAPQVALEPKFAGATPGRKHWAAVYSLVLAGAGVARGAVYGASDHLGAYPKGNPVSPGDIAATMFAALGLDPAAHYTDSTDRPYPVATGKPITGLYTGHGV
jgi:hypothetical protein